MLQVVAQRREAGIMAQRLRREETDRPVFETALHIIASCLPLLQKKDMRELTRSCGRPAEEVQAAVDYIRTLDPRPGQRYNISETRLIEPDVAFVKRDETWVVLMNEEDMPSLRLNQGYRRMLRAKQTEKGSPRIRKGALQERDPIAAQYRAAQEHHCAYL